MYKHVQWARRFNLSRTLSDKLISVLKPIEAGSSSQSHLLHPNTFRYLSISSKRAGIMANYKIEVISRGTVLGEGPHYVAPTNELFYVDIIEPHLLRTDLNTGETFKVAVGESTGFIIPVEGKKNQFIVGYDSQLLALEWDGKSSTTKALKVFRDIKNEFPGTRFNDAKTDPQGRIWAGTYGFSEAAGVKIGVGVLFSLDLDGTVKIHLQDIGLSNGLGWSKDGTKFYFIDTYKYEVLVFDFDGATGSLSNRRVLLDPRAKGLAGVVDGMCMDDNDNLYIAMFGGASVIHVDGKTGEVLDTIDFTGKCTQITSCAFGGANLDELFVTSATYTATAENLAANPDSGATFKVTGLGTKGPYQALNYKGNVA